ncbi:MAG: phenylalanine--tRNA ligase subunit beta [Flavobacteriales bacterium]|jgi:phenylalanyl-tRNA synthetase beta chain|nr:phenylalanine--tRNA ligase subunit beta [Flavobacteriales bacterium]MBT5090047.1 phenylalanine--tRNA ligase subunit beta [Flavobacteriales bacterium]
MNISYSWLKNYLNLNLPAEEISQLLTDTGLEVEGVKEVESIKGGLKGIVVGEVITKIQHPNADRLSLTTVDIGKDELLQIVCGAPNINVGQKVPVATVGTWLYDGDNKFKIKKGKIRGEDSVGMVCGADEIGLGKKTDGIMVLDAIAQVGTPASEYFKLESDIVFEIGLTPNRSDAMGHIGVARDLLTVLNHKGNKLQMCKPSTKDFKIDNTNKIIEVEVADHKICPRYSGLSISGIKVTTSPEWLQNKLKAIGIAPTNNVVDITNYVLHEMGQPLHAFDANKIEGDKIVVASVKEKTKFTTLDGQERELSAADLMISDAKKPLCIAGVFGGLESGVSESTTDVFLESAYFNPVSVRKSAKRHHLNTDASFRFERGCDPNSTVYALKRAALLIQEICGGKISSNVIDIYPNPIAHFAVELTYAKMDSLIGEVINRQVVKNILIDLEIEISNENSDGLSLLVPPFRSDVQREVDVIEEVLRIYGFNTIAISSKLNTTITNSEGVNPEQVRNMISDLLSNTGFNEAMNNSLTKEEFTALIPELNKEQNITLLNPLSQDLNVMRQSLLFSGLENIAYNQNRKNADIKFYEFGKTYHKAEEGNIENQHLQILVSGRMQGENWNTSDNKVDFYFIKEKVEHILNRLGVKKIKPEAINTHGFSQGLMYTSKKKRLVCFGRLDPKLVKAFGVKSTVYAADFNWDLILELTGYTKIKYQEVSKFPEMRRDLSLLVNKSVSFDELKKIAVATENKILKSVNLFDVYEGDKLPEDKKSYALSFTMADDTRTLTDIHVDKVMEKLMKSFTDKAGAEIR